MTRGRFFTVADLTGTQEAITARAGSSRPRALSLSITVNEHGFWILLIGASDGVGDEDLLDLGLKDPTCQLPMNAEKLIMGRNGGC